MGMKKKLSRYHLPARDRLTPPTLITKAVSSAAGKAANFLDQVRTRLDSPRGFHQHTLPQRKSKSDVNQSENLNSNNFDNQENVDLRALETCSLQTTSTSSSAHSGLLSFALPTSVDPREPLPVPTCRLGAYQAEWQIAEESRWRIITENAFVEPLAQLEHAEPDLATLKRINRKLQQEHTLLETKVNILFDALVKQTALVHHHEKKLDKLRTEVKKRIGSTPEQQRSKLRKELETNLEQSRVELKARTSSSALVDDQASNDSTETVLSSETPIKKPFKFGNSSSTNEGTESTTIQHFQSKKCQDTGDEEYSEEQESSTSDATESHPAHAHGDKESATTSTTETKSVTVTDTAEHSSDGDANNMTSDSSKELEEEEASEEQEVEEAEEEELSETEDSQFTPRPNERPRVVQFGKVSRR